MAFENWKFAGQREGSKNILKNVLYVLCFYRSSRVYLISTQKIHEIYSAGLGCNSSLITVMIVLNYN